MQLKNDTEFSLKEQSGMKPTVMCLYHNSDNNMKGCVLKFILKIYLFFYIINVKLVDI